MTAAQPTPEWMTRAACAPIGGDAWYPEPGHNAPIAKAICRSCPVAAECLAWSLEHDEQWGIWGGLSAQQRRRLKPRVHYCQRCGTEVGPAFRYCLPCGEEARLEARRRSEQKQRLRSAS